jgi:transporter family-2 protein
MAFVVGLLAAMQPPINAALARRGGPFSAATVSFMVGTLALLLITFLVERPNFSGLRSAPTWQYTGGFLGAIFVFSTILLVPRLGATGMIAALVGGQIAGSILLDHFGLFGLARVAPTPARLLGLAFLVLGGLLSVRR